MRKLALLTLIAILALSLFLVVYSHAHPTECMDENGATFRATTAVTWIGHCNVFPEQGAQEIMLLEQVNGRFSYVQVIGYDANVPEIADIVQSLNTIVPSETYSYTYLPTSISNRKAIAKMETHHEQAVESDSRPEECGLEMFIDGREMATPTIYQVNIGLEGVQCNGTFSYTTYQLDRGGWAMKGLYNGIDFTVIIPFSQ